MPRATCRCGQALTIPADGTERVVCPRCAARVRILPQAAPAAPDDGYLRFHCPCGKRLKVRAADPPTHGRCPDCGEVVPVPAAGAPPSSGTLPAGPGSRTAEIDPADLARLEGWSRAHEQRRAATGSHVPAAAPAPAPVPSGSHLPAGGPSGSAITRSEAGLRLCPNCRKPVHLNAQTCRHCKTHVPKR